jgi:GntR family transcriptional regulator/MocR family aminotransferase
MRDALYHLERSKPATLQAQIREILMAAISAGQLVPSEPVPSTRAMARRLGVSRNTVTLAYQTLVSEGFLAARERSGFYVDAQAVDGMAGRPEQVPHAAGGAVDWGPRLARPMTAQRFIQRPRDWQRFAYPFIYGQVDHAIFPIAEWRDCVRQAMGKRWLDAWTVDRYTEDDPLLLEEIARRILPRRGISAQPEQILVTAGAQNGLYLVAELLVGRETRVVIENPGYPDLRNMLTLRCSRVDGAPVDAGGMVVEPTVRGANLVFCTPSHQSPTTVTMPLERRKALLAAARLHDFVVVEDDYEFETNYMGTPLPALKSLDEDGRVIHVGSLSKSLMPGLRLGYVVADARLIDELRALRRLMLRHPPGNNQRATAIFMANGHYDVLVRRIHRVYRERWQVMAKALAEHLPGWFHSPGFGGSSYWMTGPEGLDSERLCERAMAEGVLIEPGMPFYFDPEEGRRRFRLGFSSIPAERIGEGIRRLRAVIDGMG